jgi:integrase
MGKFITRTGMRNLYKRGSDYVVVVTDPNGKRVWKALGAVAEWKKRKPRELEDKVRELRNAIKAGKSADGPETFERVFDDFMARYVEEKKLRTAKDIRRNVTNHVLPVWGARDFIGINRGDVAKLLDNVTDNAGPVMADKVLTHISKICNWYATRHHDYVSPIVRGMRRSDPKARARSRILNDDEIRIVWRAAEANGVFGAFVRMALLTGQRAGKLSHMKWEDLEGDVWHIPAELREKGNAGDLVLPQEATRILGELPRFASCPYVFTHGRVPIMLQRARAGFDPNIAAWVIHDLRRTAKSLMARAGVRPDISERVLGHVIKGVEGIYDRHEYRDEKAHALRALAGLIESILALQGGNVVQLRSC